MKFSVFLPADNGSKLPALYFLSGLTCTEDNFIQKAGALKLAAKKKLILICPDTSPRGLNVDGEDNSWDFGVGASFYVDATVPKWKNYQMYSYITIELPGLVNLELPIDTSRVSIFGHSMGGHGALICALRNPGMYKSASAFAPISNPINCAWGQKCFTGYLGDAVNQWKRYDATELSKIYAGPHLKILVDQGSMDTFLKDQLKPGALVDGCLSNASNIELEYRLQDGYDHSYWFIQTFIDDHLEFHSRCMSG